MKRSNLIPIDNGIRIEQMDCSGIPEWVFGLLITGRSFTAEEKEKLKAEISDRKRKISELQTQIHTINTAFSWRCLTCGTGIGRERFSSHCLCKECSLAEGRVE